MNNNGNECYIITSASVKTISVRIVIVRCYYTKDFTVTKNSRDIINRSFPIKILSLYKENDRIGEDWSKKVYGQSNYNIKK